MLVTIAIVIVVAIFLRKIAIEINGYDQKIRVLEQKQTEQEENKKQLENTLKQEVERLNKELESAKQAKAQQKASTQVRVASVSTVSDPKLYIYNHESGNNPARWNSSGCVGLGQACPASKLLAVCPDINDYACQDAFFTRYAVNRYGSWQGAYNFWIQNKWW